MIVYCRGCPNGTGTEVVHSVTGDDQPLKLKITEIFSGFEQIIIDKSMIYLFYLYIYIYTLGAWGSPGTPAPRGFIYMKLGWGWGGVGWGW